MSSMCDVLVLTVLVHCFFKSGYFKADVQECEEGIYVSVLNVLASVEGQENASPNSSLLT
jgi:hypothetical protein